MFTWTVPSTAGEYKLKLIAAAGSSVASDSLFFHVVQHIPVPPVITGMTMDAAWHYTGTMATVICHATNSAGGTMLYRWTVSAGSIVDQTDSLIHWRLPQNEGLFQASCSVSNPDLLTATAGFPALVKKMSQDITSPFAYYPFDGDVRDYSGNGRDGILSGAQLAPDPRGAANKAYVFSSGGDIIYVPDDAGLNFQDQIALAFWVKLDAVTQESYLLSHGSWEERWKVSVMPDMKLRWTIKTASGIRDLDSSIVLQLGHFYHVTVVYSNYSMEIYINGVLDTFMANSGLMTTTTKDLTFGRKDISITNYHLRGTLDEVRIYDKALAPDEIETLQSIWNAVTSVPGNKDRQPVLYPNPSHGLLRMNINRPVTNIELTDLTGRKINFSYNYVDAGDSIQIEFNSTTQGIIIVKIETSAEVLYRKILVF
jgi:hypothetical protein